MARARTIAATLPREHAREESLENFHDTRAPETLDCASIAHNTNVTALRNPCLPQTVQPKDPGIQHLREREHQEDIQDMRYLNDQIWPHHCDNAPINRAYTRQFLVGR